MKNTQRYHFLYCTTNLVNEKYYIGVHSTYNLKDGYLGSGKRLKYAIKKYGKENFKCEILQFFESREEVLKKESEIVNQILLQDESCMNLICGGSGSINFIVPKAENQFKWSSSGGKAFGEKLKKDEKLRKKIFETHSKTFKKLHSEGKIKYDTFSGLKHSEETKSKIGNANSIKQKGEKNSQYGTCWIKKEKECKKIKKENLQNWINQGWIRGR